MINRISLLFLILVFFFSGILNSQSLTGTSGLFSVPTADILDDGKVAFGINYMDKKYLPYSNFEYNAINYYAAIGFLPCLEVTLRISRMIDFPGKQALGDRMPCARFKFLNESENFPAFLIGAHDFVNAFGGTEAMYFNSLYLVSTKHFKIKYFFDKIGLNFGYGTDWIKAKQHQFVGCFYGASFSHKDFFNLYLEYDAKHFNCGSDILLLNHFKVLVGLINFNSFNGGISYNLNLRN